jgi:hypothetical protein
MFSIAPGASLFSTRRARYVPSRRRNVEGVRPRVVNPTGLAHTYQLRADRRCGRRTKRGLRDRGAAGNGDYLDVDVDGRPCAWGRDDARFSTGPKCPDPVTDKTVKRMAVRVDRLAADAMRSRVVPGAGWTCIVAVIFVGHDG